MSTKNNNDTSHSFPLGKPSILFISYEGQYVKILPQEILWASSDGNYACIQTKDKQYVNRISLSNLLKLLPANHFTKVHKCFIVQITAIDLIDKSTNEIIIHDHSIPIGRSYKKELFDGLNLIQ